MKVGIWDNGITEEDRAAGFGLYADAYASGADFGWMLSRQELWELYDALGENEKGVVRAAFRLMGAEVILDARHPLVQPECEHFASWCAYHGNGDTVDGYDLAVETTKPKPE